MNTNPDEVLKEFTRSIESMSPDHRFQTMVESGIYTRSGELTKQYGGQSRLNKSKHGPATLLRYLNHKRGRKKT